MGTVVEDQLADHEKRIAALEGKKDAPKGEKQPSKDAAPKGGAV